MKKIYILLVTLLFSGLNAYAGNGDMIVNGKLGIGTPVPAAGLDVSTINTDYNNSVMRITNTSLTGQSPLDFYIGGSLRGKYRVDYGGNVTSVANGGSFYFITGGDYGTGVTQMLISPSGNVGIGTTSPSAKLEVGGNDASGIGIKIRHANETQTDWGLYLLQAADKSGVISMPGENLTIMTGYDKILQLGEAEYSTYGGKVYFPGGNVGIGTIPYSYRFQLSVDSAAKPGTNTWQVASDERLKTNIRPFNDGLKVIMGIDPVWYKYNGKGGIPESETAKDNIGIIAQQIQKIAPYTVGKFKAKLNKADTDETELLDFNSHALTFVLINAIKEQQQEIADLKQEIADLKKMIK